MADTRQVQGATALAKKLRTIRANARTALLDGQIMRLLLRNNQERFRRQVDPDGKPWTPLSPITVESKRRKQRAGEALRGSASRVLVQTGALRGAIAILKGINPGGFGINTGAGGRIGIADPDIASYGAKHQTGLGRRLPRRRFLGVSKADIVAVDSLLKRAIIQKSGLR